MRVSGDETIYRQQAQHFWQDGVFTCLCELLLQDLKAALIAWWQAGECLIVFLDANENMISGPFHDMLTGTDFHIYEAITSHHPDPQWSMMATFQCGNCIGCFPIDGCFVTLDLNPNMATWLGAALGTTALQYLIFKLTFSLVTTLCRYLTQVLIISLHYTPFYCQVPFSAVWILDNPQFSSQPPLALH